ncbi:MAG: hypothetical protein RLP09_08455 [Sandaracinaceae bacterium]
MALREDRAGIEAGRAVADDLSFRPLIGLDEAYASLEVLQIATRMVALVVVTAVSAVLPHSVGRPCFR